MWGVYFSQSVSIFQILGCGRHTVNAISALVQISRKEFLCKFYIELHKGLLLY